MVPNPCHSTTEMDEHESGCVLLSWLLLYPGSLEIICSVTGGNKVCVQVSSHISPTLNIMIVLTKLNIS